MSTTETKACTCATCPGATCTCGCQNAAAKVLRAGCECGPSCSCGTSCGCKE